jgi:hypothetical protein
VEEERLKNAAEIASNIAVVLVAVAVLSFAIAYFWIPSQPKMIAGLEKGQQFSPVPNLDYKGSEQTLLIVLNTDCSYCQQSVPLFRKVMDAFPRGNKSLRVVALFPNKIKEVADYLRANALNVDSVADVNLDALHVPGTPTMILVNRRGEVQNFWLGKLEEPESAAFLRELKIEEMETPQ